MSEVSDALPASLCDLDGVDVGESAFGPGSALWVGGKEICHREGADRYDVRLTRQVVREMRPRLRADARVHLRRSSSSDWVEVELQSPEDELLLVELVSRAVEAHRPLAGTTTAPPPTGGDLERRRRSH